MIKQENKSPHAHVCIAYERYLRDLRGLAASSRLYHAWAVRDFLSRGLAAAQELRDLTPQDIERYGALRSREVSRSSLQQVVGFLRSFLRYCHDQGHIERALDVIETPRTYHGELPPQALNWSMVQALIRSVDLHSKAGRRDHCILHLMVHYGLRPSEVNALRVDSIDWGAAVLHVVQRKTQSDLLLPLMPQTMRILHNYLAHDRSAQGMTHPELFLRVRCPTGPMFEAARAQRQFDAVDPGNRLVAAELERRWNERLAQVSQRQAKIEVLDTHAVPSLTPQQRDDLLALGADLPWVWSHPAAGNEVRKRILRCVIMEIVARVADAQIMLIIHWQGGDHTELNVVKNRSGQHRWTTNVEVKELITQLARQLNDGSIAALLNLLGHRTGKGHTAPGPRCGCVRSEVTTKLQSIRPASAEHAAS